MYLALLIIVVHGLIILSEPNNEAPFKEVKELSERAPKAEDGLPAYPDWGCLTGLEKGLIPCPIPAKKSIDDFMDREV
jgi:hypothetical protein